MSTCNRLDLQTLGSQPIMPKKIHDHCFQYTLLWYSGLVYAMDNAIKPWRMAFFPCFNFMFQLSWSNFLQKYQFTKSLAPSLGVNQMWIKRNDQKVNVLGFLTHAPGRQFWKEKKRKSKFDHSLVFPCLHLFLPPKKIHQKFIITTFLCHRPLPLLSLPP